MYYYGSISLVSPVVARVLHVHPSSELRTRNGIDRCQFAVLYELLLCNSIGMLGRQVRS